LANFKLLFKKYCSLDVLILAFSSRNDLRNLLSVTWSLKHPVSFLCMLSRSNWYFINSCLGTKIDKNSHQWKVRLVTRFCHRISTFESKIINYVCNNYDYNNSPRDIILYENDIRALKKIVWLNGQKNSTRMVLCWNQIEFLVITRNSVWSCRNVILIEPLCWFNLNIFLNVINKRLNS